MVCYAKRSDCIDMDTLDGFYLHSLELFFTVATWPYGGLLERNCSKSKSNKEFESNIFPRYQRDIMTEIVLSALLQTTTSPFESPFKSAMATPLG